MRKVSISVLFGLGLALLVLAGPGLAQRPDVPALVRLDLTGFEDLARVAELDLPVYAHLTAPGADYLLAVLTPSQQEQVLRLGLALSVLDADARDAVYYLVESGQPQMLEQAASAFTMLYDDGHQAVGRRRAGVMVQAVEEVGLHVVQLGPDPVVLTPRSSGAIPTAPAYDPLVAGLLTRITSDALVAYAGGLSGEWPVSVGGQPYLLTTRYTYSGEPIAKATQYVYEHLQGLGYDVRYHDYTLSGYALRNVVGEKRGRVYPDRIVLLTAHLDSRAAGPPHDPAPGADDNGSGASALMVAADLLADVDFAYTVRIVFFTGEEQGMWGSYYYARDVASAGEDILGVLNLDMIAWDARGGPAIDLYSQLPSVEDDSDALADLFAAVVATYGLNLEPQVVENGPRFSDHARFWDRGYAAIMAMEDYYNASEQPAEPRDWNANYHTAGDRLSTLNLAYLTEYARASLATFVHLARPVRTLSGTVASAVTGAPLSATVTASSQEGLLSATTDASGAYALALPGGVYTIAASAYGYYTHTLTGLAILTGTGVRLGFLLVPIPTFTVSGMVSDAASGLPLGATVELAGYGYHAIAAPGGSYSARVYSSTYVMTVSAPFHYPVTRTVVVDRAREEDVALWATPCVLVVDDDYDDKGNAYEDQAYYTRTLEELGVGYDLWRVPDDRDGPPRGVLGRYHGVVWLTGRDWDYTLTRGDQGALTAYLEGGGRLFVSGQDVGWDVARFGEPPFYQDYLHADYLRDKSNYWQLAGAGFLGGVNVTIQGGDGANNQRYPSDVAVVGEGVGLFRYPDGDWGAIAYADGTYRAVYLAFGFEGISSAADRRTVMRRVLTYLNLSCPESTFTVSGMVSDAASGLPLSATVQFDGYAAISAPTGFYSATVFSGTYGMTVNAPFHYPATRTVTVDRDREEDLALWPTPCVLVVDDDYDDKGNGYEDQAYYTRTLEELGVGYDLWRVPDDRDGPPREVLGRYHGVVWLTGRDWDYTLTRADQGALTAYLEGGGRLFVSGQDVGWDVARFGEPPFYRDYLHADYLKDDSGYRQLAGTSFLGGVNVAIQGGDGANNQRYPSDIGVTGDGVGLLRYPDGDWGATAYADGTYRMVYLAFGFEGISSAAGRRTVMDGILVYLDPCASYNSLLSGRGLRFGEPGESVTHTVSVANIGTLSDTYDLALGGAAWVAMLPVTRSALLLPQQGVDASLVVSIPPDAVAGDQDRVALTVTSAYSPAHAGQIALRTVVGHKIYLPLVVREWGTAAPEVKE